MFIRAVIDTNVLFEGLTNPRSMSGLVIEAWLAGLFQPVICQALIYEYQDVLQRMLSPARWRTIAPRLDTLLDEAKFADIYYSWRPMSPDPGDDHVIDCVQNANGVLVTLNLRDFRLAVRTLGIIVLSPVDFVTMLTSPDTS
jgi:predicted nucleic acid-binding protein